MELKCSKNCDSRYDSARQTMYYLRLCVFVLLQHHWVLQTTKIYNGCRWYDAHTFRYIGNLFHYIQQIRSMHTILVFFFKYLYGTLRNYNMRLNTIIYKFSLYMYIKKQNFGIIARA